MFLGCLTSWLFFLVALTVWIMRIVRKEIDLPISLRQCVRCMKASFLFFTPGLVAFAVWIYQLYYHTNNIAHESLSNIRTSSYGFTLYDNFLFRTGIADGVGYIVQYLRQSFYTHMHEGYGISGTLLIYAVLYMTTRGRKFIRGELKEINLLRSVYLMFFIPPLLLTLFFARAYAAHAFSSLLFSPVLSISFVFAPIFTLQMMKKDHLSPAVSLTNKKSISFVALIGVGLSILYGYVQIYDKAPITKMFSPPDRYHNVVGNFVRKNTEYHDVLFSKDYFTHDHLLHHIYFTNKYIHYANNLDLIYQRTKIIADNYTIKVLYFKNRYLEIKHLSNFLADNNIQTSIIEEENIGNLLSFDGKEFCAWYEHVHECDLYPPRCGKEG